MRYFRRWTALCLIVIAVKAMGAEPPLSLVVLGSGGPGAVGRAPSGFLLLVDGVPRILIDAEGHADLKTIATSTDLLGFNAVVLDPPQAPPILYTLHTAPADIVRLAAASGAHSVLLDPLSPATDLNRAEVEASIRQNDAGPLRFAEDRDRIVP